VAMPNLSRILRYYAGGRIFLDRHPHAEDVLLVIEFPTARSRYDRDVKVPALRQPRHPGSLAADVQQKHSEIYRDPRMASTSNGLSPDGKIAPILSRMPLIHLAEVFSNSERTWWVEDLAHSPLPRHLRGGEQLFDQRTFPTRAGHRMA